MTTNDILKKVFISFLKQKTYSDPYVIDTLCESDMFTCPPRTWVEESIRAFTVLPKNIKLSALNDGWQETLSNIREQFSIGPDLEKPPDDDIKEFGTFEEFWENSMLNNIMVDRIFKTRHKATWNAAIKSAADYIDCYGADSDTIKTLYVI